MKHASFFVSGLVLCALAVLLLLMGVSRLGGEAQHLQGQLTELKGSRPGLGEYMTTTQLHMGKLWFAAEAANWKLAHYELGELGEALDAAQGLHAVVNGTNISGLLDAVQKTQVARIEEAIGRQSPAGFRSAYDETVAACNGCHQAAGRKFIHIVRPTGSPVTNQQWSPDPRAD